MASNALTDQFMDIVGSLRERPFTYGVIVSPQALGDITELTGHEPTSILGMAIVVSPHCPPDKFYTCDSHANLQAWLIVLKSMADKGLSDDR